MTNAGFDGDYAKRAAENYERSFVPLIGAPLAADLIAVARLRRGERVLDVACGTGVVTKLAAEEVGREGRVAGADPNPAMLAVARETTPPWLAIQWHQAPAEDLPLEDERFDAVLCGLGLQFFSDRQAALRELHRVRVRGGRLVASVPGPTPPPFRAMADSLAQHISSKGPSFVDAVFALDDPDQLHALATDAGFENVQVEAVLRPLDLPAPAEFLWQYIQSTPLAALVASASGKSRTALEQDFVVRCQPFVEDGHLVGAVRMITVLGSK